MARVFPRELRPLRAVLLCLCLLLTTVCFAVTLEVTPSVIASNAIGSVTLDINGVTAGQTIVVERYLDGNANGIIDATEALIQRFLVTDGLQPTLAGQRVPILPADEDGLTNGHIRVSFSADNPQHFMRFAATSLYRITTLSGTELATASLRVTAAAYGQTISGQVTAGAGGVGELLEDRIATGVNPFGGIE